jgi:hypothetical protein
MGQDISFELILQNYKLMKKLTYSCEIKITKAYNLKMKSNKHT